MDPTVHPSGWDVWGTRGGGGGLQKGRGSPPTSIPPHITCRAGNSSPSLSLKGNARLWRWRVGEGGRGLRFPPPPRLYIWGKERREKEDERRSR